MRCKGQPALFDSSLLSRWLQLLPFSSTVSPVTVLLPGMEYLWWQMETRWTVSRFSCRPMGLLARKCEGGRRCVYFSYWIEAAVSHWFFKSAEKQCCNWRGVIKLCMWWLASRYLAELTRPPARYQRGIIGAGITGRFTCQTDAHYQYGFNSYCLPTHPLVFIEPSLQVPCAGADWYSHTVEQYTTNVRVRRRFRRKTFTLGEGCLLCSKLNAAGTSRVRVS